MRGSIRLAALTAAALITLLPVATAQASVPAEVMFTVPTTFDPATGISSGHFSATGPAVGSGLVCPSGDTVDIDAKASGYQAPPAPGVNIQVVKKFTCDDGSGTFEVKLQVRVDARGNGFQWVVMEGTDAYATLRGAGSGYGSYPGDGSVIDHYAGALHID